MHIKKRDGSYEKLSFDKVIYRLRKLCKDKELGVLKGIDSDIVAQRVISGIYDGVTSCELDEEAARIAVGMTENVEYQHLASRIIISNLHKSTNECFSEVMEALYNNTDKAGKAMPVISDEVMAIVREHKNTLNFAIDYSRDYLFDYFGYKTLERSYLMKIKDNDTDKMVVVERPQHMYMRVAVGIHREDIDAAVKTYNLISQHYYTHASPTLFNSGTRLSNLSSCFSEDTIVATVNRGPVKIKDVLIGDTVVTHKGNVKSVVQLHKNLLGDRKFYEVAVSKTAPIKVTDNHKLWVIREEKKNPKDKKRPQYYDLEFVKNYLENDNCELLSKEYKNIKEKLLIKCVCGKTANVSFEGIYYKNIRCNDRKCIYERHNSIPESESMYKLQWVSVEDLKKGDYIGIPNKTMSVDRIKTLDITDFQLEKHPRIDYEINYNMETVTVKSKYEQAGKFKHSWREHSSINRYWNIDNDFAKFVGIFYGDGHIMRGKNKHGDIQSRGIGITIYKHNVNLIEFCKNYGEKLFGITPTIHTMTKQNVIQVLFNSVFVGHIFKELFGLGFNNKKVWTDIFKWEKVMIGNLLDGLVTTDGCITSSSSVSLQMSNVDFMRELYYLFRNNNIDVSYGKPKIQKNATKHHIQMNIPLDAINKNNIHKFYTNNRMDPVKKYCKNQYSPKVVDGFRFLKFEGKTQITENLPEYVYTLGVEDDHSYNVEGIVAENCFLIGTDDNIEGIFKTVTDCARISKVAGGIGLHVSNIRARGSLIRGTNGPSDGIVPMLKVYNETAKYINQGSRRKGSFAIYLEPFHADIMEFLELKKNQGHDDVRARDLFYAIWMPDLFMKQVETDGDWYLMCPDECPGLPEAYGDEFEALYWRYVEEKRYKRVVKAQDVWKKILEAQIESGVPYIAYKDAVNKKCNQKNLGTIKSSNLCVAPETMILTSKGYYPISQLENVETDVWNGESFSTTTIKKTGVDQELLKVVLSNGSELECTPYHKFYIAQGKRPSAYPRLAQIDAKDLQKEMILIKSNFPIIKEGSSDFPYPYEHGLFCADGTLEHDRYKNKLPRVTLYGEKINLAPYLTTRIEPCAMDKNGRVNCRLPKELLDKYTVPLNCNLDIKLRWLEGLMDGDGTVVKSDGLTGMQLGSIHLDFLKNVKYMLQTMGCDPKITEGCEAGWRSMPDGKGGHAQFYCQKQYRFLITSHDTSILYDLGFRPKRLQINGVYPRKNTKRWIKVEDVIRTGRISDTYCFKEEKRGMGIFNGILTGQCAEISLYSDHENYAICNLCSIALPKYVKYDQKGKPYFDFDHLCEIAEYVIGPMNKVIDNNYYATEECRKTNMAHRPLGIGVQGLADVYFKMGLPFESPEAKALNREIFETIYYGCMKGSIEEAKRDGPYDSFKGSPFSEGKFQFDLAAEFDGIKLEETLSGRRDWDALRKELVEHGARNSMLMALMPTASTAQIMNNTEAFEPIDSCIFKRRVLSGEYMVINKYLVAELLELGLWSKEMKDRIIGNEGSIQGIPEIPQRIKDIYKTVWEISMKSVIEQAADRGVFVDQMQSMNLFMANPNYKKLTSMHFYAWRHHLKTGMYYLRSKASASAGKFSIDANLEKQLREAQLSEEEMAKLVCSLENKDACEMCSS